MLTIRREQIRALAEPGVEDFLRRAAAHLREYFGADCTALGEVALRDAIRHGYQRASGYGLETERDLLRYLTLMFVFGRDFDVDPAFPWAREVLGSASPPSSKTDRLHVHALRDRSRGRGYAAHA
jgi:hypothetical protein